jgi:lipopolysaccharide assembly protein A
MRLVKIVLAVLALTLTFLFFRQNLDVLSQSVQFKLNLWIRTFQSVSHPLWVLLAFTLFIGVLGTGLYSLAAVLRLSKTNRQLQHDLDILKQELATLRPSAATPAAEPDVSAPTS